MPTPLHFDSDPEKERNVSQEADLRETGRLPRPNSPSEERVAAFLGRPDSFPEVPVLPCEAISRPSRYPHCLRR